MGKIFYTEEVPMKKFWIIFTIILIIICIGIFSTSFGNEEQIEKNNYNIGTVTAESLKIRSGLSTKNDFIGLLSKNDIVHIYDKIDNWYIVKTENNLVGAVFADYIEVSNENNKTIETSANTEIASNTSNVLLSQDEQIFFNLINNKRIENNLPEFKLDENLLNIARLKAQDIIENKYFSHTSPTYGTIFEMLQQNNISYSSASENIARNINADSAIECLMNSESHRKNILSDNFNYTGIAVLNSIDYGKIFVEIFISK